MHEVVSSLALPFILSLLWAIDESYSVDRYSLLTTKVDLVSYKAFLLDYSLI
jgi:hypothetical protein